MSINTKSAEVWALADKSGFLLARGNPNAERPDSGEPPCPPYHLVSYNDEKDFFMQDFVWARRKWELDETGARQAWNNWIRRCPWLVDYKDMMVRPVKVRFSVEFVGKEVR